MARPSTRSPPAGSRRPGSFERVFENDAPLGACAFVVASCRGSLHAAAIVLFGACGVASLCIFLAYASLFAFHAYLAVLGMGTYDWILAQRAEPPKPATELVAKGARVAQEEDAA